MDVCEVAPPLAQDDSFQLTMIYSTQVGQREVVRHKNQILPLWSALLLQPSR